ncbi:hypothetical protein DICPUDRAFT_56777 [Dictyostelium purpureum]|uniref:3',5'-cyclic-GMP phosphodiesterase n=1 Tax=Dictyostelium purpureum TaxID=5786 RepID=F0ZT24_DICPU|nr:uncharacterized protein DICPUDRAFT_56777 [Dictyostelium purpureum]EGC32912.1 hypothetical protein DICPUDRAFT_56777 [Dictyostelium purpureum]|eukprot:XP_003290560.1 hypothetical protein DICPUDRAFT_56777 [Dictyostelium purpureum]
MNIKNFENIINILKQLEKFVKSLSKDNKISAFETFKISALVEKPNLSIEYFENLSKFLLAVISAKIGNNFIRIEDIEQVSDTLRCELGDQLENLPTLSYERLYIEIVNQICQISGTITEIIEGTKATIQFLSSFKIIADIIDSSENKLCLLDLLSSPLEDRRSIEFSTSYVFNKDFKEIEQSFQKFSNDNCLSPDSKISELIDSIQLLLNIIDSKDQEILEFDENQVEHNYSHNSNNNNNNYNNNNNEINEPYFTKNKIEKFPGPSYVYKPDDSSTYIQVGIPPDQLKRDQKICHFIVPHFLISNDVSLSEVEFPIFYNKFVQKGKNKVVIICTTEQKKRIETILSESIFGPAPHHIYTKEEIVIPNYEIDVLKERLAIDPRANAEKLESYVEFKTFNEDMCVTLNVPSISREGILLPITVRNTKGLISFHEGDHEQKISVIDSTVQSQYDPLTPYSDGHEPLTRFKVPALGVTFLGVSHGLDFNFGSHTTGFIIWINGSGVVVDPPVGNTTYLQENGIYGKKVEHIILTHCHADHDSGILQKIIERNKVTLYTTKTINESYMRKLKALTGTKKKYLRSYYTWVPVTIGNKIKILGAEFEFDYSFHVIPTIRFKLEIYGKKISYSADTFYDLDKFKELKEKGELSDTRIERLKNFVFDADMIIHESGVAPIHTPITNLLALPEDIRKKIRVVHCSHNIDTKDQIVRPKEGLENTEVIKVDRKYKGISECIQIQMALNNCNIFSKLSPLEVQRMFYLCNKIWVKRNDVIIRKNALSDSFYIILSGKVLVYEKEWDLIKNSSEKTPSIKLCAGETLGESALQLDKSINASATVVAETDVCLLVWKTSDLRSEFHSSLYQFIQKVHMDLSHINSCRDAITRAFQHNITQYIIKEEVDSIANGAKDVPFKDHETIFNEGDESDCMYIIKKGRVRISSKRNKSIITMLGVGDFFGETAYKRPSDSDPNLKNHRTFTATALSDTVLLKLDGESIVKPRIQNIIEQKVRKNTCDNINRNSPILKTPRKLYQTPSSFDLGCSLSK